MILEGAGFLKYVCESKTFTLLQPLILAPYEE